jgi:hypothetical protein
MKFACGLAWRLRVALGVSGMAIYDEDGRLSLVLEQAEDFGG